MGAHSEKTHIPTKGTEKRNKMPGPQLTRDDLNSLLIFENLCNDWVREVHRFTSERKKKKNFVIFRNCENKKLTSLEGLKEELEDTSFLENAEFKSAFSHDIVSNKVGANKRARRAAKAWMADPTKQGTKITPVQEATPVEETAPVVEESNKIIQDDETKNEPEDIKSYEKVIIPVEDTPNVITEEEIAAPVGEQLISAVEETPTDPVIEEATSVVEEEQKALAEETPDVDVEEEAISSFEEITVPVEEEVKAPVEESPVVETDADEEISIVEMKEDVQEIAAPLEEEISSPAVEEATTTVEETKESVAAQESVAVQLPTVDLPSKLPEVELVITQTSEETNQIEE